MFLDCPFSSRVTKRESLRLCAFSSVSKQGTFLPHVFFIRLNPLKTLRYSVPVGTESNTSLGLVNTRNKSGMSFYGIIS